jgi:hypothetical protein
MTENTDTDADTNTDTDTSTDADVPGFKETLEDISLDPDVADLDRGVRLGVLAVVASMLDLDREASQLFAASMLEAPFPTEVGELEDDTEEDDND